MLQPKLDRPSKPDAQAAAELYDRDPVLWSEQQAQLLTAVAAGERPAGIDWANIIEEIESVGRSQTSAVESLLLQALVHEFKARLWPDTSYVEGWGNESLLFQAQAAGQFTTSMRQKIDVSKLVARAARAVPRTIDGAGANRPLLLELADPAMRELRAWLTDPDSRTLSLTEDHRS